MPAEVVGSAGGPVVETGPAASRQGPRQPMASLGWTRSSGAGHRVMPPRHPSRRRGGVNAGHGWTAWATGNGSFVPNYVADSRAHGLILVFTYYNLYQSAADFARHARYLADVSAGTGRPGPTASGWTSSVSGDVVLPLARWSSCSGCADRAVPGQ